MRYKSDILEAIHENAAANFEIGAISEAQMREYDEMCLEPEADSVADSHRAEDTGEIEHIGFAVV